MAKSNKELGQKSKDFSEGYLAARKELLGQFEQMIIDELLICRHEGTRTSRLTSLFMKVVKLK